LKVKNDGIGGTEGTACLLQRVTQGGLGSIWEKQRGGRKGGTSILTELSCKKGQQGGPREANAGKFDFGAKGCTCKRSPGGRVDTWPGKNKRRGKRGNQQRSLATYSKRVPPRKKKKRWASGGGGGRRRGLPLETCLDDLNGPGDGKRGLRANARVTNLGLQ